MSDDLKFTYLKAHPLFVNLSDQRIKDVSACSIIKKLYKNETLNIEKGSSSHVCLLIKGMIKINVFDESGNAVTKEIFSADDVFGDLSLAGLSGSEEYAESLTNNTILCTFNVRDFKRFLEDYHPVAMNYVKTLNINLKKLETRNADLVYHDAKFRLIRFIQNWAEADGYRSGDKVILNNCLTHSDIASIIATSRQNVNVILNELRNAGILFYNRKIIELNYSMVLN